jgi:H+/Cl- antiporter ClcA
MPDRHPDFWALLRREFVSGRQWIDRAVVLAYAAATGALVVGFTLLSDAASDLFSALRTGTPLGLWLPLVWTPLLTVVVVSWTRRYASNAAGSGVPQVVLALEDELSPGQRQSLVSLRLALHKIALVASGLLAGLSIGREGPTVQVGAGIMQHAGRWLSPRSGIDAHDLMVAGAAAGIAAAFNTPLGGVIFALEQLSKRRSMSQHSLVIACIVLAGMVSISVFGNFTYFGELPVQQLQWTLIGPGIVVAVVAGLAGGLFSRLVVASLTGGGGRRIFRWRHAFPLRFAAACALAVAVIGIVTHGATDGAGYATTRALLEGRGEPPPVYTLLKFCATWLSAWAGVPAGLFSPALSIGAGIGHDVAVLLGVGAQVAIPMIALGMVAFLAATTQGPITAFIIVMEMVSSHAMVLSLMGAALLGSAVARLVARPMYGEIAAFLGARLPPAQ